jgi:hypothetical protein
MKEEALLPNAEGHGTKEKQGQAGGQQDTRVQGGQEEEQGRLEKQEKSNSRGGKQAGCYDTTLIFLDYEIVAMGLRSMNVDVADMHRDRSYPKYLRYSL